MSRKSAFVKVSGDLYKSKEFIEKIAEISKEYFVVICVGGGTQINKIFEEKGVKQKPHGPLGRELDNFEDRQKARDILEKNQAELQDILARKRIPATVIIPVLDIGTVLCHVNGDQFLQTVYLGYNTLFVVTTHDRLEQKKKHFAHLPKIKVISLK
jgi:acetylglutamate kinase